MSTTNCALKILNNNSIHSFIQKVCGQPRKNHHNYSRWERFVDWCVRSLHAIQDIANKRRRNYILDQVSLVSYKI